MEILTAKEVIEKWNEESRITEQNQLREHKEDLRNIIMNDITQAIKYNNWYIFVMDLSIEVKLQEYGRFGIAKWQEDVLKEFTDKGYKLGRLAFDSENADSDQIYVRCMHQMTLTWGEKAVGTPIIDFNNFRQLYESPPEIKLKINHISTPDVEIKRLNTNIYNKYHS